MMVTINFTNFTKGMMNLNYNRIKEINTLFIRFKALKSKKQETLLKKERIMKNVDEFYKKYYNAYKNHFENDDELDESKNKKFNQKQFELFDKRVKKLTLDEETKLTELPKWLHSKNDFKKAIKLIEDIRADTNNDKSSGDKKVFNNLDKLINGIKTKKLQEKIPRKK